MWQIAASPCMPDEVVGKYQAMQDAEKRQASTDRALEIVAKMKGQ